jgi:23S rRNA U2552 (ribose-2'-O)-methylase RlmE/FtsJ
MYQPFIFELESGNSDILKTSTTNNLILSSTINIPLISLGFHNFLHRTKSAMSITNKLQTKNEFYYIINPFEHIIPNYEDSLKNLTDYYLGIKDDNPAILSSSFYKMWEILYLFGIADKKELTYASLADGPEAFIQAVINYREKLGTGVSNDKIFSVTIHSEKEKYTDISNQFLGYYNNNIPNLIKVHKATNATNTTNTIKKTKSYTAKDNKDNKNNKDIETLDTIKLFKKDIEKSKKYTDLVTADGELKWDDINYQEQEGYQLILGEIIAALRVQAKDGAFVLKVFETFTIPSIKMIYLLSSFYEKTYIYKPYYSRASESEKYVICKGFKFDQKQDASELDIKLKSLEKVLEGMNSNKFVYDIYSDMTLPSGYLDKFKFMNIKISNPQQIMINEIVIYIKENNYFGEKYHKHREQQIEATKWWVSNFYPPSNNLHEKNKEDLQKLLTLAIEKNNIEQTQFISTLIK